MRPRRPPGSHTGKLVFVFVAGVEGCGHHGLTPVLGSAFQHSGATVLDDWIKFKEAGHAIWCTRNLLGLTRRLAELRLGTLLREQRRLARSTGRARVVIEDNSFPSGPYRDPRRQWRLPELFDRVQRYADETYLIGLYRHPIASTYSHKDWDAGILRHARLLRDCLVYVNDQIAAVTNAKRLIVHYEDLLDEPDRLARRLAAFFGLPGDEVRRAFGEVKKSTKDWRVDLGEHDQAALQAIFDATARSRWPILAKAPRVSGLPLEH